MTNCQNSPLCCCYESGWKCTLPVTVLSSQAAPCVFCCGVGGVNKWHTKCLLLICCISHTGDAGAGESSELMDRMLDVLGGGQQPGTVSLSLLGSAAAMLSFGLGSSLCRRCRHTNVLKMITQYWNHLQSAADRLAATSRRGTPGQLMLAMSVDRTGCCSSATPSLGTVFRLTLSHRRSSGPPRNGTSWLMDMAPRGSGLSGVGWRNDLEKHLTCLTLDLPLRRSWSLQWAGLQSASAGHRPQVCAQERVRLFTPVVPPSMAFKSRLGPPLGAAKGVSLPQTCQWLWYRPWPPTPSLRSDCLPLPSRWWLYCFLQVILWPWILWGGGFMDLIHLQSCVVCFLLRGLQWPNKRCTVVLSQWEIVFLLSLSGKQHQFQHLRFTFV